MKKIDLTYQKNVRDLGGLEGVNGKHIKYNCLFRGGVLARVSSADIKTLKSLNLTDIVDFRGQDEFINHPDYKLDGVSYHNFSVINNTLKKEDRKIDDGNLLWFIGDNDGNSHLLETYIKTIRNPLSQQAYKEFFKILVQDNKRVYFHCSQGKDRAGMAAFFIEMALGVKMEDAIEDYLLSNQAMVDKYQALLSFVKDKPFFNKTYEQSLKDVFSAKLEYLNAAIKEINDNYGGIDNYLVNVLEIDIEKLRKLYLE